MRHNPAVTTETGITAVYITAKEGSSTLSVATRAGARSRLQSPESFNRPDLRDYAIPNWKPGILLKLDYIRLCKKNSSYHENRMAFRGTTISFVTRSDASMRLH